MGGEARLTPTGGEGGLGAAPAAGGVRGRTPWLGEAVRWAIPLPGEAIRDALRPAVGTTAILVEHSLQ
jgi:hypothetical protein